MWLTFWGVNGVVVPDILKEFEHPVRVSPLRQELSMSPELIRPMWCMTIMNWANNSFGELIIQICEQIILVFTT